MGEQLDKTNAALTKAMQFRLLSTAKVALQCKSIYAIELRCCRRNFKYAWSWPQLQLQLSIPSSASLTIQFKLRAQFAQWLQRVEIVGGAAVKGVCAIHSVLIHITGSACHSHGLQHYAACILYGIHFGALACATSSWRLHATLKAEHRSRARRVRTEVLPIFASVNYSVCAKVVNWL